MEETIPIKAYNISYRCDICKSGYMESTGKIFLTNPLKYEHKCNQCGKIISLMDEYPRIRYEQE